MQSEFSIKYNIIVNFMLIVCYTIYGGEIMKVKFPELPQGASRFPAWHYIHEKGLEFFDRTISRIKEMV